MRKKADTILALDPGLRDLGYAVLRGKHLLAFGVLQLESIPATRRLAKIRQSIEAWVRAYAPSTLVHESIPKRPLDSLAGLPALGRMLRRQSSRLGLETAEYSVKAVRRTVVGDGWAGKREVAEALSGRFPELRLTLTHDRKWKARRWQNMYDALALAIHHQRVTRPPSRSRFSD